MNGAALAEAKASFTRFDRAALASLIAMSKAGAPTAVEIGSGDGLDSTQVFLDYHCRRGGHLLCVDLWTPAAYDAIRDATARGRPFIRFTSLPVLEAARQLPDRYFDIVFVGAAYEHHTRAMGEVMAAWWPKLKPGGILAGRAARSIAAIVWAVFGDTAKPVTDVEITLDDRSKGRTSLWWIQKS